MPAPPQEINLSALQLWARLTSRDFPGLCTTLFCNATTVSHATDHHLSTERRLPTDPFYTDPFSTDPFSTEPFSTEHPGGLGWADEAQTLLHHVAGSLMGGPGAMPGLLDPHPPLQQAGSGGGLNCTGVCELVEGALDHVLTATVAVLTSDPLTYTYTRTSHNMSCHDIT